jgi:hypothetical protein
LPRDPSPWGKFGIRFVRSDAALRAETRHGVGMRLHAGRWRRRVGRPHRDPDSRGYHFARYHGAALAERYGGARGTRRTPGTGRERSPPSPVRSGHLRHRSRLTGNRASCAGSTRGSRTATTGGRPEFALPRGRGSSARIHGPSDRAYVEPSTGVAQQPKGYTAAHSGEDFGHGTQDAGRPRGPTGCIPSRGAERARGEQTGTARKTGTSPSAPPVRGRRVGWLFKTPSPSKARRAVGLPHAPAVPLMLRLCLVKSNRTLDSYL